MTRARTTLLATIAALTVVGAITGTGPLMLGGHDANAVIGRPLTPMSYAGVARRTTRRAYYGGAYGGYGYGGGGYAYAAGVATGAAAATVAALPAGCAYGGGLYTCGAVRYRPYYDGPNLVYTVV